MDAEPAEEGAAVARSGSSLRLLLLISYVALAALMAVSLSWAIGSRMSAVLAEQAQQRVARLAFMFAQRLDDSLADRLADLRMLAVLPLLQDPGRDPELVRPLLAQLRSLRPDYAWIGRVDEQGRVRVALDGLLEGQSVAERPWFAPALDGPMIGDAHEAVLLARHLPPPADGQPLRFIDLGAPVYDAAGVRQGVVAAHLSLGWAAALQDRLSRQVGGLAEAEVLVINRESEVLIGPAGQLGRPLMDLLVEPGYLVGLAPTSGVPETGGLGWSVVVRIPREQALREIDEVQWAITAVTLVIGLLALGVASVMARLISRPLRRLSREARQIIAGEARDFVVVRGYRESEELSVALHTLTAALGQRQEELERLASGLEQEVAERTAALEAANARLAELAITDALTGLANRRHFDERLAAASRRSGEGRGETSLLLVDIDHFKAVNDRFGHPAGDEVLRQVAALLVEAVRPSDLVARIGGEEFAVLAADTSSAEAVGLGERLLSAVRRASPLRVGRLQIPLSVSVGVAESGDIRAADAGQLADRLLSAADTALYQAKQGGRDRLCRATRHT